MAARWNGDRIPLGHTLRPETVGPVETEFRQNFKRALSPEEVERIIRSSENEDAPIRDSVNYFVRGQGIRAKL